MKTKNKSTYNQFIHDNKLNSVDVLRVSIRRCPKNGNPSPNCPNFVCGSI